MHHVAMFITCFFFLQRNVLQQGGISGGGGSITASRFPLVTISTVSMPQERCLSRWQCTNHTPTIDVRIIIYINIKHHNQKIIIFVHFKVFSFISITICHLLKQFHPSNLTLSINALLLLAKNNIHTLI